MAPHPVVIIAGDIGGTSTRLALFEPTDGRPRPVVEKVYRSRERSGLEEIVQAFVAEHHVSVVAACFGIAGPVRGGEFLRLPIDSARRGPFRAPPTLGEHTDEVLREAGLDEAAPS